MAVMNKLAKYIIVAAICAAVLFLAWFFGSVLTNILIAAILSLIGKPAMKLLTSIRVGRFKVGNSIAAVITLILLACIFSALIVFIVPLVGRLVAEMGSFDFESLKLKLAIPLMKYNIILHQVFPSLDPSVTIESLIIGHVKDVFSFSLFTDTFSSLTSFLVNFVVSAFTITFVTFFFLKDSNMFTNMVLIFVPVKYEENTKRALDSINDLLVRYFTGISVEALFITVLNTIGLCWIGGLSFQLAVVLAFLSGVLNVIPYIGPVVAGAFGTLMGIVSMYGVMGDAVLGLLIFKFIAIFVVTHIIDVFIFQPFIYSNSVKAHPLEIFLVILIAGNIAGILGMLVAIPAYTVLRVFAKEFFSNFKLVQRLTDNMLD